MDPITGKTGERKYAVYFPCPHADRMRLRRVPKWLDYPRDDGYGKLIPITERYKRRIRRLLKIGRIEWSEITHLERRGHTTHCAKRQVWGDGQCECCNPQYSRAALVAALENAP